MSQQELPSKSQHVGAIPLVWEKRFEKFCVISGFIAVICFFAGMCGGRILPPMQAYWSPEQVSQYYQAHHHDMAGAGVCLTLGGAFYLFFAAVMGAQTKRIVGTDSVIWMVQITAGSLAAFTIVFPGIILGVATLRPDRDTASLQLVNDIFWINLVQPWQPFMPGILSFSFAVLLDRRPNPPFPRWLAFVNMLILCLIAPNAGLHYFQSGPLSWGGAYSYWAAGAAFGIMFILDGVLLWKGIDHYYANIVES
ncbi:hypothetical protein BX600DRAFT_469590 [Xylariales sp. PMI_506]|nr:hypothetical protein BX600DRAFT_469590 [Xylariales sp. PMI_506]